VFVAVTEWTTHRSIAAAVSGSLFMLSIFGTVVLHEFGHALTAPRFGVRSRDITLLPIGGVARLERMPDVPRQELWVALAGPAVNVVIAIVCYGAGTLVAEPPELSLDSRNTFLGRFIAVNVSLAVFNMVPAFPMDGGRALRALLAERLDYVRATEIAATLGQGLALLFGFIGILGSPMLLFIALFVWMGATGEASMVGIRSALANIPVSRAMITDFKTVSVDDTLRDAVTLVLSGSQRDFPVLADGQLAGILSRDALVAALAKHGLDGAVTDAMTRTFETVDAREMLESAFVRLQHCECPVMPVTYGNRLVGLLTAENVGEFVMIRGALSPGRRR
jgi:Zn-dependent protease/CBS domain-containing protein